MNNFGEERRRSRRQFIILSLLIFSIIKYIAENHLLIMELLLIQMEQAMIFEYLPQINERVNIRNYLDTVSRFSDRQFQEDFRLTRTSYELLESIVCRHFHIHRQTHSAAGRPHTSLRKQLLSTIWLLGTPESYRSISERFDLPKSVLYTSALKIVKILCKISNIFIKWPNELEQNRIKRRFLRYGIPGVVGAVDGTFIYCSEPKENGNAYNTRKCRHAIQLQGICTASLKFIDAYTGYPGSVGDHRIFRNSDIYKDIERNPQQFFPQADHILGDKAYPLKTWCLTPYRDNGRLSTAQRRFNTVHSSARCAIEHAFSLLKGRFRRLKHLEIIRHDLAPYYILASCVLHNICLDVGGEDVQRYILEGSAQNGTNAVVDSRQHDDGVEIPQEAAINKREYLCNVVNSA